MIKILNISVILIYFVLGLHLNPHLMAQAQLDNDSSPEKSLRKEVILPSPESVEAKRENVNKRIKELEQEIGNLSQEEQHELLTTLNDRLNRLREIEAFYQRQLQELKKRSELKNKEKVFDKDKALQIPSKPPYSVSLYDQHLNELSEKLQQKQTAELALSLSEKLFKERELSNNKAKRTLDALSEEEKKDRWTYEQLQIELEYREAAFDYQKIKHSNNLLALELAKKEVTFIEEKIALISRDLSFNKNELQSQLDTIKNRRNELTEKIELFLQEQRKAEILWITAQRRLEQTKNDEEFLVANAASAAQGQWYETYQQMLEQYEGRQQLLNHQEEIWKKRYDIINKDPDYNNLKNWHSEENLFRENIESTLSVVQSQHTNLQLQIAEIEARLSENNINLQFKNHLQNHLKALRKAAESNFYYLAALQTTKQLSLRLSDEVDKQLNEIDIRKRIVSLWNAFVNAKIFETTLSDYFLGLITILGGLIIVKLIALILISSIDKWSQRVPSFINNFIIQPLKNIMTPLLYLGVLYLSVSIFTFHPVINKTVSVFAIIILTIYFIRFVIGMTDYLLKEYWCKKDEQDVRGLSESSIQAILPTIRIIAWALGAIFLLDNLGFNISTVIAGLGIGGIAIALAAQNILGDLFNYFVILFDRPFEIGDFIIVDQHMGNIEHVGIKTTKIRSLNGEQIVFSNTALTGSQIKNYKRMLKRRVLFQLEVVYQTPLEQLKEIPEIIKNIISEIENVTFDRAHFSAYKPQSLTFEVVYYVIGNDYTRYMDIQQTINLKIKEELMKKGIHFAYATQVLHLNDINKLPKQLNSVQLSQ